MKRYSIPDFNLDLTRDLFLIAGPCVIESRDHVLFMASELKKITSAANVPFVFKASLRQSQPHVDQIVPRARA